MWCCRQNSAICSLWTGICDGISSVPSTDSKNNRYTSRGKSTLSELPGEQAWRESGFGSPAEVDQLQRQISTLEQQIVTLKDELEEHDQELDAARAANRDCSPTSINDIEPQTAGQSGERTRSRSAALIDHGSGIRMSGNADYVAFERLGLCLLRARVGPGLPGTAAPKSTIGLRIWDARRAEHSARSSDPRTHSESRHPAAFTD